MAIPNYPSVDPIWNFCGEMVWTPLCYLFVSRILLRTRSLVLCSTIPHVGFMTRSLVTLQAWVFVPVALAKNQRALYVLTWKRATTGARTSQSGIVGDSHILENFFTWLLDLEKIIRVSIFLSDQYIWFWCRTLT